jgi:hypothetical protein
MIRKLVLAMTILALAAVPLPAWAAGDSGHDGRHEIRGSHERFRGPERFGHGPFIGFGFYPSPYYAYAPPACAWQPGYSVNQPMSMRGAAIPTYNSGCRGNGSARRDRLRADRSMEW